MTPTVGRIVLFRSKDPYLLGNGSDEVPAIITRVWSDSCVNLQVFRDNETPVAVTSVSMSDDLANGDWAAWRWMPYQKAVAAGEIEATKHA